MGWDPTPAEHICEGLSSLVANFVAFKDELFDGGVFLSEIEGKDTVSGGALTGVNMHGKGVSIVGAHFRIRWVKQSADTDRESLGNFGPAFVRDLIIIGHV